MESNTRTEDRMWNIAIGALGKLKQAQGALEHVIERASEIYEGCEDCAREKSEAYATLTDLSKAAEALTLAYNLIDRQIANALDIPGIDDSHEPEPEPEPEPEQSFISRVSQFSDSLNPEDADIALILIAADVRSSDCRAAIIGDPEILECILAEIMIRSSALRLVIASSTEKIIKKNVSTPQP